MTVRNMRPKMEELIQYITPDGVVYNLYDPPDRYVMLYEGDGMPPMDYGTTSGPFQHGETVTEVRLMPRIINAVLRQRGCDRDAYWAMRTMLDNMLRPNRTDVNNPDPGVLRRRFSSGEIRDLDVYVSRGPVYQRASADGWDEFSFAENIQFKAVNPILYDPTLIVASLSNFLATPSFVTNLIFPFSFPFVFGTEYTLVTKTLSIDYAGNWEEYPTIVITGPATNLLIRNTTLGDILSFDGYTIAAGQVVTIDLSYSRKTIVDNFGDSWLGRLSDDSDLTSFRLEADPLAAGGINAIEAGCVLGDTTTNVEFRYRSRFIGADIPT